MKDYIVISIGGFSASSRVPEERIHKTVIDVAKNKHIELIEDENHYLGESDGLDAEKENYLEIKELVKKNGDDQSKLSFMIVGKSMGGAKICNLMRRKWAYLKKFKKIAMVTVDAHGRILFDGSSKPYGRRRAIKWQSKWTKDKEKFRTYNVFQQRVFPHGADFPKAQLNTKITDNNIDHYNIIKNNTTKDYIGLAFNFIVS